MTKHELNMIRHTQVIKDPFPEHSAYAACKQMLNDMRSPLERLFRVKFPDIGLPKPEEVSIWAAYRKGYEQAYAEIEQKLDSQEESTEK